MIEFITINEVILCYEQIIDVTGGKKGLRDFGLLDSSLNRCFVSFDGIELYPSIISKISVTCYSLINNHCFIDGNKRIGIQIMCILLELNNIFIDYSQKELIKLGLGVASGKIKENDIENWIIKHII